ncbi:tolloid-like protein 2 [Littorina saxatilis]|uniref:tolloid-like protein 2 n=1 Tax=Littorina saxatilis TaxID=31220 RepID=UPI0038B4F1C4
MKLHLAIFIFIGSSAYVCGELGVQVTYDVEKPHHAPDFNVDEHQVFVHDGEEEPVEVEEEEERAEDKGNDLEELKEEETVLEDHDDELKHLLEDLQNGDAQGDQDQGNQDEVNQDELSRRKRDVGEPASPHDDTQGSPRPPAEDSTKPEEKSTKASNGERRRRRSTRAGGKRRRKRAAATEDKFWQDCIVPYAIESTQKAENIKNFHYALDHVSRRTCIKFVKWDKGTKTKYNLNHNGYVLFKKAPGWGFAQLGNTKGAAQQLSCTDQNNCVHEILHALGFEHEQKDPRRHGIVRINWKYITPSLLGSYKEMSHPGAVNLSEPYDISSTLHYRLQYGPHPEMTLLFPELSIQEGSYYQFREVSESYRCKERFCKDYMTCENDGYVISRNDVCQCICPVGLDPATGCTSIFRAVNKATAFPGEKYALPAPLDGCPEGQGFSTGSLTHLFPYSWPFPPYLLKGKATWGTVTQHFCVKDGSDAGNVWPKGSYCIYRYGGSCPADFKEGWIQFDNKYTSGTAQSAVTEGSVADGVYKNNSKMWFCCRDDASPDVPVALPSKQSFAMFPVYGQCQRVAGAKAYKGEVILRSDTADGVFGHSVEGKPETYQFKATDPNLYLRYCAYYPTDSDCGGVITLSETNRKAVITSPNYPEKYDNNLECHWFIKGPNNSTLTLTFSDFDLEGVQGKCLDNVEVSTYMVGQRGSKYCGNNMRRTHRSILNKMHVTLDTGATGQHKGFKATVEVHLAKEDCFNHRDLGHTYRGKVDYTEELKTCLPWSDPGLKQCYHYATNPLDINAGLEANYCRNPGDGVRPWCYTNATGCERGYCDVCQLGVTYDHHSDCAALLAADSNYCQNEKVARANCALTCKDKLPNPGKPAPFTTVKCPIPQVPSDGEPKVALTGSYGVGDKVTFKCKQANSTWTQTTTCMGDGAWSPLASACTGCPEGWWPFQDSCYWASPKSASFVEAQQVCSTLGGELAEIRDQAAMDVFFHIRDDGVDQWIGLKKEGKGNWTWQDGSKLVWNKWTKGSRKSQAATGDKSYCATVRYTDDWYDDLCTAKVHFNCRRIFQEPPPSAGEAGCKDTHGDCAGWAAKGECKLNPGYMKDTCPKSCNACPKACKDIQNACSYWASSGECERNVGWMTTNCQLSCSKCPPPCRDRSHQCAEWQALGECQNNKDFMTARCQKTCNRCPENCSDDDKNCGYWAKAGECERNPRWMLVHCSKSCNRCPPPGECVGRPCGANKCTLVDGVKPVCLCPVGSYGEKCEGKFPCEDRAGPAYCSARQALSPTICKDFPEFSWYMCKKTCGKC